MHYRSHSGAPAHPNPSANPLLEQRVNPEMEGETTEEVLPKTNYKKDIKSILLLFFLYILQGVPLGLIQSVPFLLQSQGVSYDQQAKFSLAQWPFSLKVFYAPIIDSIYLKRLGRRKSWLIPLQYLICIFLLVLYLTVDEMFLTQNVTAITVMFFVLNFLAASQDVAVDGWALTMLSPENVGYASTCNAVGQTLGYVFGYSGFMALESASFANMFRTTPLNHGLATLPQFLLFWAIVFGVTTTLVLVFKKEGLEPPSVNEQHMNIFESYKNLWRIIKLKNVRYYILFLFTVEIGMAATDALSKLKLVEVGVPKETMAFFAVPLIPVQLLVPIFMTKWTVGSTPMKLYINIFPFSLCFGIIYPIIVFWLPYFRTPDAEYTIWVYASLFVVNALELFPQYARFVTGMGFAAKISDPTVGGTYMTLINTVANVGGTWPSTLALWLVSYVEIPLTNCNNPESNNVTEIFSLNYTSYTHIANDTSSTTMEPILDFAYSCLDKIDGYYVESAICFLIGSLWLIWGRPTILRLQKQPKDTWTLPRVEEKGRDETEMNSL